MVVKESVNPPTVDALVSVMEGHGIETVEYYDAWAKGKKDDRVVVFEGDETTGFKVVELALEIGLDVDSLCQIWHYFENEAPPRGSHWELYLLHAS